MSVGFGYVFARFLLGDCREAQLKIFSLRPTLSFVRRDTSTDRRRAQVPAVP